MTRSTRGDQIVVKPRNDVYTALTAVACVVVILGLIVMFTQAQTLFGDGLFFPNGNPPAAGVR